MRGLENRYWEPAQLLCIGSIDQLVSFLHPRQSSYRPPTDPSWSSIPFYVVGQATATVLAAIGQIYGHTDYTPSIIRGESSGTGERLAQFIRDQPGEKPKRLLYLTGDKNRDTVPTILREAGIELVSLTVYETQNSHTFEEDLEKALRVSPLGTQSCYCARTPFTLSYLVSNRWWIIHFAPSAAEFVTPILNKHLQPSDSLRKIAAIGPVTASFLRNELNMHVDVISPKPTAQDLVAAIGLYDKSGV